MDFYQSLGNLILASRLKRISEYYISELNTAYQSLGIVFETSWFPIFYLLSKHKTLSIKEISDEVAVSHSATSQLVSNLKKKGFVASLPSTQDKRKILVELTEEGKCLLKELLPVWDSISMSMQNLECENPAFSQALQGLSVLEKTFEKAKLSESILENLNNCK